MAKVIVYTKKGTLKYSTHTFDTTDDGVLTIHPVCNPNWVTARFVWGKWLCASYE